MAKANRVVLLVEDDADLAEMYRLQIEPAGYEVILAADAQAALDSLDDLRIDAVILDILLPKYNGLGILHELRSYEDWRRLPVIILSNVSAAELGLSKRRQLQLGIAGYLDKATTQAVDLVSALGLLNRHGSI